MYISTLKSVRLEFRLLSLLALAALFFLFIPTNTFAQTVQYTAAQVATHNTSSNCWSIIDGNVYDLTAWIPRHPGGQSRIIAICGINGSTSFHNQHGNSSLPASTLVGYKVGVLGTTPPADTTAPTISSVASTVSGSNVTINWSTNESSDSQIEYGLTSSYGSQNTLNTAMVTSHTMTLSSLNPNTVYSYRVKSKDAAGNVGTSGNFTFTTAPLADTTAPTAPSSLTGTAISTSQINLTWSASTDTVGVTGYQVDRCSGTSCTNFVLLTTVTGTTYTNASLPANTAYRFRVRATDVAGNLSAYSTIVATATLPVVVADTTPPTTPSSLTGVAVSTSQINLTWSASTDTVGVTGYQVERCSGASCTNFVLAGTAAVANYAVTTLTQNTTYRFRVRATDTAGNLSTFSSIVTASTLAAPVVDTTAPTTPSNLVTSAISSSQINLTWGASTDAVGVTGYQIDRCSGTTCTTFVLLTTVTGTTYSNVSLAANTPYRYRVRARDASGNNSSYSTISRATTLTNAPPPDTTAPTTPSSLTGAAVSTSQINLTWGASTDAVGVTGYQVERCSGASCTNFSLIATVGVTNYSVTALSQNTAYRFRIRTTDAAGNLSAYSSIAAATTIAAPVADTTAPTIPTNLTTSAITTSQVILTWSASTDAVGVTGYQLERCQGAGCSNYSLLAIVTTLAYTNSALTSNTSYSYRVKAVDAAGNNSGYSSTALAQTQEIVVVDTTPPSAALSTPARNATVSGTAVEIGATASDASGVSGVQFYIDGVSVSALDTTSPYGFAWDTTSYSNGSHDITARATDSIGNSLTSAAVRVSVQNSVTPTPPANPPATTDIYTAAQVSTHNSPGNCWTIIDGSVYDLTNWAAKHPGGQSAIGRLCGIDGSSLFHSQHGSDSLPANALRSYKEGTLAGPTVPKATTNSDTTSPTVPTNVAGTLTTDTKISLTWNASTDNVAMSEYQVYYCVGNNCLSFKKIATVTNPLYVHTLPAKSSSYNYRIKAIDSSENSSRYSDTLKIKSSTSSAATVPTKPATTHTEATPINIFTTQLALGTKNPLVQILQLLLIIEGVFPGGEVTGFYGEQTEMAVKRLQSKYAIITSGTPNTTGYGAVGPKTREKLNDLLSQLLHRLKSPTTTVTPSKVTATAPSSALKIGSTVYPTGRLNVRLDAKPTAKLLGLQEINSQGVIIAGPVQDGGYTWWNVKYVQGVSGWSVQDWLSKNISTVPTTQPVVQTTTPVVPAPAPKPVPSKYTRETVAGHASPSSCWTIIDNNVYDLTNWIQKHPGGADAIGMLCGTDGSSLFHGQHGSDAMPANALKAYKFGAIGS